MSKDNQVKFSPKLLFFYGTLTLEHVLKEVAGLTDTPILRKASITRYTIKLWGPYPALVKATSLETESTVQGKAWLVCEEMQMRRLAYYEGRNYRMEEVEISLENGKKQQGYTFVWDGAPEDLKDGVFNPGRFSRVSQDLYNQ